MIIEYKNKKISQETINLLILITKNVLPWINDYNNINISMETKTTGVISDPENSSIEPTIIKLKLSGNNLDYITYTKKKLNHTWSCTPINEALILNSNTINDNENDIIDKEQLLFDLNKEFYQLNHELVELDIKENNFPSINLLNKDDIQYININPDDDNIVIKTDELNYLFSVLMFDTIEKSILFKLKQLNTNKLILQSSDDIYAVAIDENKNIKFQSQYGWVDMISIYPSLLLDLTSEILETKRI